MVWLRSPQRPARWIMQERSVVVLVSAGRYERGPRRDAIIDELLISFLFRRRLFF